VVHDACIHTMRNMYTCTHAQHVHNIEELAELQRDLNSLAPDWFNLGLQLDIDDAELTAVSGQENRTTECFRKTLREWLKIGTPTHDAIIEALRSIGHKALAKKLGSKGLCYAC